MNLDTTVEFFAGAMSTMDTPTRERGFKFFINRDDSKDHKIKIEAKASSKQQASLNDYFIKK